MTENQVSIIRYSIIRLALSCCLIACILPVFGQDSLGLVMPERNLFGEQSYKKPSITQLKTLPSKPITSNQLEVVAPEKIQLQGLEKQTFNQPEKQAIKFNTSPLLWNKSLPIDFHKFNDRSKLNLSKFDSDQGLVSDMIQDMVMDREGIWWLATADKGLIQYDGTRQRVFTTENGLSSNLIHVLLIDHKGQLWIGSDKGIDIFDGQQLKHLGITNGLPGEIIWALYEDQNNQVWIGTEKGLVRIDSTQKNLQLFTKDQGLPNLVVWTIHQDNKGQTWVGTEAGLAIIEENPETAEYQITTVLQSNGLPIDNIWSIDQDKNGDIWMGSNGYGIFQWSTEGDEIRMFNSDHGLSSDLIWDVQPVKNGIWFGTYSNGAIHYEEKDGKSVFTQLDTDEGITNNYVLKIASDQQGGIWMGTDGGGVTVLHEPRGVVKHYNEGTGLNEKFVQCVFRDSEGLLWMGTDSRGVNIIDEVREKVTYLTEQEGLSYNAVWDIDEDKEGNIWIGTESGLNIYNKKQNTLTKYDSLSGLSGNSPWTLFRDNSDNMWIGTEDGGLCKYDAVTKNFVYYKNYGLDNTAIMGFTQDNEDNVWVATRGMGLFRISPEDQILVFDRKNGLSSDSITYLYHDSEQRIWAGTEGHGVNYFEPGSNSFSFKHFKKKDGLSHDDVWSIIEDDTGRIWVGTVDKITILNINTGALEVAGYVSTEQGLKSNDLNSSSVFKEKNGNLIWATIKGPSVINPSQMKPELKQFKVVITEVEIEHQSLDFREDHSLLLGENRIELPEEHVDLIPYSNVPTALELPHQIADIHINFIAQKAYFRKDLEFQYRLLPYDEDWETTQTSSSVILNNLGPGEYTTELRARANGGLWGPSTTFQFTITTPWWDTWLARIAGMLIVILALYAFYIIRTRSLIKSKEFLEDKVKERTYELERSLREVVEARNQLVHSERMASLGMLSSGIAHELSNPISAVYNVSQLIERDFQELFDEKGDPKEARKNIEMSMEVLKVASNQTREIIRGLTNYSRLESKEMILGDVHQCLDNSVMLIQSKLGDIQVEKEYHPEIPLIRCYYTELTQVFLNLISNAIDAIHDKGDTEGLIRIHTSLEKRFVKVSVTDTGIGMSLETSQSIFKNFYTSKEPGRGTGLGLAISQGIIKKHQGSISFETEKDVGTTFITLLPIASDEY
ncbi:MAG: two-component regulator propeller domain-containing protein [Cytophagales bacterium]|nr:two-component regulator propeller domain-containing protein [Cytophagales bacterium]